MEGKEILAVVDSVSSEKGLEKDVIFVAMELAIASASQRHFHEDAQLIVEVDRESGEFITKRQWEVLDENDEEFHRESYISPSESSMEIGELYFEQVDNVEFGRIETQAARQVMLQKVREADKSKEISDLEEEIGDVLFSVVNLARHLKLDSEDLLRKANSKFINRFKAIEKELVKRGRTIDEAKLDEMDEIWDQIKSQGK